MKIKIKYKEFSIIASAEYDDDLSLWNGRYRIMDDEGVVPYESFVEPQPDEEEAIVDAKKTAIEWINAQTI